MNLEYKMKLEKTYRDFVNDVITQKIDNKVQFTGAAHQEFMKKMQEKKDEKLDYKSLLKSYAQAFLLEYDSQWVNFIRAIISSTGGTTPVVITKYQFMQAFFTYYFDNVFGKKVKNIRACLEAASETTQFDKNDISKGTIKKVYKIIKKGEKNKKVFVSVFNSLYGGGW